MSFNCPYTNCPINCPIISNIYQQSPIAGIAKPIVRTHGDDVRAMTDEELSKFLDKVSSGCDCCPNRRKCLYEECEDPADACAEMWLKWLKEEPTCESK